MTSDAHPAAVPHDAEASIASDAATPDPERVRQLLEALAATLKEQVDPLEPVAGFWIRRSLRQKGARLEAAYWARQSFRAVRRTHGRRPKKTRERQLLEDLAATVKPATVFAWSARPGRTGRSNRTNREPERVTACRVRELRLSDLRGGFSRNHDGLS